MLPTAHAVSPPLLTSTLPHSSSTPLRRPDHLHGQGLHSEEPWLSVRPRVRRHVRDEGTHHARRMDYAGPIIYTVKDFIQKNRDSLFGHVYDVMYKTKGSSTRTSAKISLHRSSASGSPRSSCRPASCTRCRPQEPPHLPFDGGGGMGMYYITFRTASKMRFLYHNGPQIY